MFLYLFPVSPFVPSSFFQKVIPFPLPAVIYSIFYPRYLFVLTENAYICDSIPYNYNTLSAPMTINLKAFNQFFIDYQQRFVHFACTYVHDEAVAEDFVIESMMYYWENKDRLPPDTNIPAYVLTAIKHKCIDYLRHRQLHQDVSDEIAQIYAWELSGRILTLQDFEPYEVFTAEIQEIVDRTLDSLPQQTKQIFIMSRYENKSYKEIATSLQITTKGVEFHISKSTKALRLALKDYLPASLLFFYLN